MKQKRRETESFGLRQALDFLAADGMLSLTARTRLPGVQEQRALAFLAIQDELPVGDEKCDSFDGNRHVP